MSNNPQRWSYALDGKVRDKEVLASIGCLSKVVIKIAEFTGLEVININSSVIKEDLSKLGKEAFEDEGGISVQALISTSHISIHGWPERGYFMLDVVSCRKFDSIALHTRVMSWLDVSEVVHHVAYMPSPSPNCFPCPKLTPINTSYQLAERKTCRIDHTNW